MDVSLFNRNLPERGVEVNADEDLTRSYRGEDVVNDRQRVVISNGKLVKAAVVHARTPQTVRLLNS